MNGFMFSKSSLALPTRNFTGFGVQVYTVSMAFLSCIMCLRKKLGFCDPVRLNCVATEADCIQVIADKKIPN